MKKNRWIYLLVVALLVLPVLAACSGGGSGGSSGGQSINVTMTTYKFTLSKDSASAGTVVFHLKNAATDVPHQFTIVKTDLDASKLPTDANGNVDISQLDSVGASQQIQPGDSADLSVDLTAGHYDIFCDVAGHYMAGMYADFTVN